MGFNLVFKGLSQKGRKVMCA